MAAEVTVTGERADLLASLQRHRGFLRQTLDGVSDEQAASAPSASTLCLGGLIKHVAARERSWMLFTQHGEQDSEWDEQAWVDEFRMLPGETVAGVLAAYDEVAAETDELVRTLDLDADQPLPPAPWFEQGARWTTRRVILHVIAETSQHAGHADIIRETLDGARMMG